MAQSKKKGQAAGEKSRAKKQQLDKRRWRTWLRYFLAGAGVTSLLLPVVVYGLYRISYRQRAFPGVNVAGRNMEGKTTTQITKDLKLEGQKVIEAFPLPVEVDGATYALTASSAAVVWEVEATADEAVRVGRQGGWWHQIREQWGAWQHRTDIPVKTVIDQPWLEEHIAQAASLVDTPKVPAVLEVVYRPGGTATVSAHLGVSGRVLDRADLERKVRGAMEQMRLGAIEGKMVIEPEDVSPEQLAVAQARSVALLEQSLELRTGETLDEQTWKLSGEDLVGFVRISGGFDEAVIGDYLEGVAVSVNREPQNALFQFDEGQQKVVEFAPPIDGLVVDVPGTTTLMVAALAHLEQQGQVEPVAVAMRRTTPEITLSSVNDLGIVEHLGRGESTYFGSIASRVHNVRLASERINGTLVKPGEEFSFNQAVGEISGATGYKQAYVIIGGRTELGDGGGVCQVSTTMFRAALAAGLPIVDRRAHAYRVGYYEQDVKAGIDATVYAPYTDFKFLNDTPAYILIQTTVDEPNRHLMFDIYGTSDGRTSEITNHTVCCITPPPPDVFVDDPTLPAGELKQIEHAVAGAKARFDYTVKRGGETIYEKTFYSSYKTWSSVFMRGTLGQ